MIKALIIDDEPYCCEVLTTLLEKNCKEVQLLASCNSAKEALDVIGELQPELVFLDVEMPKMNGFEMLQKIPLINFNIIFTTSYDQYALKAIRCSAIDYLLKPIDRQELKNAVQKVNLHTPHIMAQQFQLLMQKIKPSIVPVNKVALPTMEGLQMVTIDSIISCESDSNYTILMLKGKQKIIVSRTLKEIEEVLEDHHFARVHHSYLVNVNEINKYVKGEGGYLLMSDGSTIDVSRSRKDSLMKKLLHNW